MLENHFNKTREGLPQHVKKEAYNLVGKIVKEKDLETQRLQEQINQLLNQHGSLGTEMEMEEPKTLPERIEIEEKKEGPPPRHGMQTRSQGPPSFGEKIQQEVFDPYGNLISKGTIYDIPNVGKLNARQVVESHKT